MGRPQIRAIYVGGFIGPYTGQVPAVVLPELAGTFGITVAQAALTMTAYLFPFAVMMLFSSRLARRIPPHKVIFTAYGVTLLFAAASQPSSPPVPSADSPTVRAPGSFSYLPRCWPGFRSSCCRSRRGCGC